MTDRATKVVRVAEYYLPAWLSDHEILLVSLERPMILVHDIVTGRQRHLRALERLVRTGSTPQVSPDGRRLLWLEYDVARRQEDDLNFFIHTADLDGTNHRRWRRSHANSLLGWMSDSRRFIEVANLSFRQSHYTHVLVRDVLRRSAPTSRLPLRVCGQCGQTAPDALTREQRDRLNAPWRGSAAGKYASRNVAALLQMGVKGPVPPPQTHFVHTLLQPPYGFTSAP